VERGWISADAAANILGEVAARPRLKAAGAASTIGAVLLAMGVILFVASNWGALDRTARLGILMLGLWGSLLAAQTCRIRGYPILASALGLVVATIFGAGIVLVAQAFNVRAESDLWLLLWAAGALATGAVLHSQPAAVLAVGLATFWSFANEGYAPLIFYIPAMAAFFWASMHYHWRVVAHLTWIAVLLWAGSAIEPLFDEGVSIGLIPVGIACVMLSLGMGAFGRFDRESIMRSALPWAAICIGLVFSVVPVPDIAEDIVAWHDTPLELLPWALIMAASLAIAWFWARRAVLWIAFVTAASLVLIAGVSPGPQAAPAIVLLNIMTIAGMTAACWHATLAENRAVFAVAVLFLVGNLCRLYFDTFWGLLDRSIFFIGGGLLLLAVGYACERIRRVAKPAANAVAS
jgi:uncharacterized membrane protein